MLHEATGRWCETIGRFEWFCILSVSDRSYLRNMVASCGCVGSRFLVEGGSSGVNVRKELSSLDVNIYGNPDVQTMILTLQTSLVEKF